MVSPRLLALLVATIGAACLHAQAADPVHLSAAPGLYRDTVLLTADADAGYSLRYRFKGGEGERFLPFNQALALSSLKGERRLYRLVLQVLKGDQEAERRELTYLIDRCPPLDPEPLTRPGTHVGPLKVEFALNPRDADARVKGGYRASDGSSAELADGSSFVLPGRAGQTISYELTLRAEDAAGNASAARQWTYVVDRRQERELAAIPVLSPVEGRFRNPQLLYIDGQAFAGLRYTLDGGDPRQGRDYAGPVLLDAVGRTELRVWGITLAGKELEKRVVFEAGAERLAGIESGTVAAAKTIQLDQDRYRYAIGERPVGAQDPAFAAPLRVAPQAGALRGLSLQLLRERDQALFRYFMVLDGRQPARPELWLRSRNPLGGPAHTLQPGEAPVDYVDIEALAGPGSRCWFRWDGVEPEKGDAQATLLAAPLRLDLAELRRRADASGVCRLVFQCRQADGGWGPALRFPLSAKPAPPLPAVALVQDSERNTRFDLPAWPGTLWYTVASEYHDAGNAGPFQLSSPARIELPFGAQGHFAYQIFGVGADGALASGTLGLKATVSLLPPDEPRIARTADGNYKLSGGGTLSYRVYANVPDAPSATKGFVAYQGPIQLKPKPGDNLAYWIEAQSRDASGVQSAVARTGPIPLHGRAPLAPRVVGEGEGEIDRNSGQFVLQLENPEIGVRYYYRLDPEGAAAVPGPGDPASDGDIAVKRDEDRVRLALSIVGVSTLDPALVGPVGRFVVNIDTRQPSPPRVAGVENGKTYRRPLSVELSADPDSQISYWLRRDGAGAADFQDYRQAIKIPAPPESAADYELMAKARNRAGSESFLARPLRFRVDNRTPALPGLSFVGADGRGYQPDAQGRVVANQALRLQFAPAPGLALRYELGQDQTRIPVPDGASPAADAPLDLNAAPGEDKQWFLRYRAFDPAGNESQPSGVYAIRIDRVVPKPPPLPRISRRGNAGDIAWAGDGEAAIQYAVVDSPGGDSGADYKTYDGNPVKWALAEGQDRLWVYYRSADAAGNFSPGASLGIERKLVSPAPAVVGVANGGLYRGPVSVRLEPAAGSAVVRYELATGDQVAAEVGPQSPLLQGQLEIGPLDGETVAYHLSLRRFDDNAEASESIGIDFTIDRTPPNPPRIAGLPAVGWLTKAASLQLQRDPGDAVLCDLRVDRFAPGEDPPVLGEAELAALAQKANPQALSGELALPDDPNATLRYVIVAYTQDAAGNRSRGPAVWQVFVEPQTVYVADPLGGRSGQAESGTRSEPFRDLAKAIDFAQRSGKRDIVVASGRYSLDNLVKIGADLRIRGGANPDTWRADGADQTIVYPRPGFPDAALFECAGAAVGLQRLYLIDAGQALACLVRQRRGSLAVDSSNFAVTLSRKALEAAGGSLRVVSSQFSCNDPVESVLVDLSDIDCALADSLFESADLPPVLAKNSNRSVYVLLDARNSKIQASKCQFAPRRGQSTIALRLNGTNAQFDGGQLSSGAGGQSAVAVEALNGSRVVLAGTVVRGDRNANNVVLAHVDGGELDWRGGKLQLLAGQGAYGLIATASTVALQDLEVEALSARDFVTILSLDACRTTVRQCRIGGAATPDFRCALLTGGDSQWSGNAVRMSAGGSQQGLGFVALRGGQHLFEDNTWSGNDQATLFQLGAEQSKLTVRRNILEHWRFLLQEPAGDLVRQSDADKGVSTIQDLEKIDRQGSLFTGNKVSQGL